MLLFNGKLYDIPSSDSFITQAFVSLLKLNNY